MQRAGRAAGALGPQTGSRDMPPARAWHLGSLADCPHNCYVWLDQLIREP
jgi:hypothetical protein